MKILPNNRLIRLLLNLMICGRQKGCYYPAITWPLDGFEKYVLKFVMLLLTLWKMALYGCSYAQTQASLVGLTRPSQNGRYMYIYNRTVDSAFSETR